MVTFFGVGYIKVAPGTFGSIAACPLIFGIGHFIAHPIYWLVATIILLTFLSWICLEKLNGIWPHDDNKIVIDEIIGMLTVFIFIPISLKTLGLGLVIFRLFDIFKPLGIGKIDEFHNNWAVIIDDVLAGLYAGISMKALLWASQSII